MGKPNFKNEIKCHICGSDDIKNIPEYSGLLRVTSDCKPWKRGGSLLFCQACFAVQKNLNASFFKDSDFIYSRYDAYHQSQGLDQVTFAQDSLRITSRSEAILNCALNAFEWPYRGSFLDIGCGKGNMLKVCSKKIPGWELFGFDLNENSRPEIEAIKNVKKYYTREVTEIIGRFDLVSMIHVLEHIPHPSQYLSQIKPLLSDNGFLIIEVPDLLENPFDLLVADHAVHFTADRLDRLLTKAGFEVVFLSKKIIPKELTVVVRKNERNLKNNILSNTNDIYIGSYINKSMNWLNWIKNRVRELGENSSIGLFGAGIASAWLIGEFPEIIEFCVDEDVNKINKTFFGKPILYPTEIKNKKVFIPMPYLISQKISKRWSGINDNIYYTGPEFILNN